MKQPIHRSPSQGGFSLTEVTIALGIFGGSILVLLGLTGITAECTMTNREMTEACQLSGRIFSDLALPQQNVLPTDGNRLLNNLPAQTPYGTQIAPTVERYNTAPLVWAFNENLTSLPVASSASLYDNGYPGQDGRFVVGVTFADEKNYQAGLAAVPPVGQPVVKRVLVSVEAPAGAPRATRRKYEFYRIMEFQ